jgi:hypothetical protein
MRHGPHQFADFRFQKFVRDYQGLDRVARVAATSRDGLVGRQFKPVGVGLRIWRGVWWYEWSRLWLKEYVPAMFSLSICSYATAGTGLFSSVA